MTRTSRARRAAVSALAAVAVTVLAGACGDDDSTAETPAAATGTGPESTTEASGYHLLGPAEFEAQIAATPEHVVNVHVPYEGELPGTTEFIDYQAIGGDERLPADKSAPVLLYCRSGRMSKIAADTLSAEGYTNLYDLSGGMVAWEEAGKPLLHNPGD